MPYGSIIPIQFQKLSAFGKHNFLIKDIWWRPYRFHWDSEGNTKEFPRSAFCQIECEGQIVDCLFPEDKDANIFEAILLLSAAYGATTRPEKYLSSFRALESIGEKAPIQVRAIRHALAHSTTRLRDPKVIDALEKMFGGKSINLRKHSHKREFYRNLGDLLVCIDIKLTQLIITNRDKWIKLDREVLLAPFQEVDLGLDYL